MVWTLESTTGQLRLRAEGHSFGGKVEAGLSSLADEENCAIAASSFWLLSHPLVNKVLSSVINLIFCSDKKLFQANWISFVCQVQKHKQT